MSDNNRPIPTVSTTNPSPKTVYMSDKRNMNAHLDLIARDDFKRAIDAALLQFQAEEAFDNIKNPDLNAHMASANRQAGAVKFVAILRTMTVVPPASKPMVQDNLETR